LWDTAVPVSDTGNAKTDTTCYTRKAITALTDTLTTWKAYWAQREGSTGYVAK